MRVKLVLFNFLISISTFANPAPSKKAMLGDIDFIDRVFQSGYVATEWKRQQIDWSLDGEIAKIKNLVNQRGIFDQKSFHQLIKNFFISAKDYHVTVSFYSTEVATLPFCLKGCEGRYFVSHIYRDELLDNEFPFVEGDEIISFDGLPIHEAIEQMRHQELGLNHEPTDRSLAEFYLTNRIGALGHIVPKGSIELSGKKSSSRKKASCTVSWDYTAEKMASAPPASMIYAKTMRMIHLSSENQPSKPKLEAVPKKPSEHTFFNKQFVMPQFRAIKAAQRKSSSNRDVLGSKQSFIPPLGTVIWESEEDSLFHAYLFATPSEKLVGYIRIPSYSPPELADSASEFEFLIQLFEEGAEALVIDQINNPGGDVLYLYALASFFADRPLKLPEYQVMLKQSDVFFAHEFIPELVKVQSDEDAVEVLGENLHGFTVDFQLAQSLLKDFEFIVDEWNSGHRLTRPCYLYGIGPTLPTANVQFTKPVLVLVNSLDFSGGDFFPAILQDSKRATIFGTRTAGAGGSVNFLSFPNLCGIAEISYTDSLAQRTGGIFIENFGVTPDVIYKVSAFDLQNNYSNYVLQVQEVLENIMEE